MTQAAEAFEKTVEHFKEVTRQLGNEDEYWKFVQSISEWSVDLLNGEISVHTSVDFPYEQGDGEAL